MRALIAWLFLSATSAVADIPSPIGDADYRDIPAERAALGQLLFYDKILSGNKNIACATCHHPRFGSADGQSLALGEGALGLGPSREIDPNNIPEQRIPRNAPALWNLGAHEFIRLFHDGRLEERPDGSGLRTPLGADMITGFTSILSAQTMFPVLSADEMAGHYDENDISSRVRRGLITHPDGAWETIAARIENIPAYRALFDSAAPETKGRKILFTDISNAIADFIAFEFRSDDSPFDAHLRGQAPLPEAAMAGLKLFYGAGGCAQCHAGKFQTDHDFHVMGAPQLGPGKSERFERHQQDTGRMRVTNNPEDIYAFRTPSLRNITLTAPYGHAGGHQDLAAFLRDHIAPKGGLDSYQPQALLTPFEPAKPDWKLYEDGASYAKIAEKIIRPAVELSAQEQAEIIAFLQSLEGKTAKTGRLGVPKDVPSGLFVDQ